MSLNVLQLKENYGRELQKNKGFIPFDLEPGEHIKFATKTARQTLVLTLKSGQKSPGINISAKDGYLYLTNQRLVYVTSSQGDINDFSITIKSLPNLQFSHSIKSPWFGANYWLFLYHSAGLNGAIAGAEWVEGSVKFLDGGLFEFVNLFDTVVNNEVINHDIDEELPRYSEV